MRTGQNPAKMGLPAYQPKKLGLALLSLIPSRDGYFAQSLDVLKYQIASIHVSTTDFDLLVFDNGSCEEVQDGLRCLQAIGLIHYLVLSGYNLGKTGALNWILASLPNELIGFADGDVLFRPGWLEETLKIRQSFPQAGLISAQPCFFDILRGTGRAALSLTHDPNFRVTDEILAQAVIDEYCHGIGLSSDQIEGLRKTPSQVVEAVSQGVRAVVGATHMQFVMPREVARRVIPLPASLALSRDEDAWLNKNVDSTGFLHLSTLTPYVYHMGNQLDETILSEIRRMDLDSILESTPARKIVPDVEGGRFKRFVFRCLHFLSKIPAFKTALQRLYNLLFVFFSQPK